MRTTNLTSKPAIFHDGYCILGTYVPYIANESGEAPKYGSRTTTLDATLKKKFKKENMLIFRITGKLC